MADLQKYSAKVCWTAAGVLIHDGKVLLVKHKKLGIWLNPGGHVEDGELPHKSAEREFWEETGIKVQACDVSHLPEVDDSEYIPAPYMSNLHWISRENYDARTKGSDVSAETAANWARGCEQHVTLIYLMEPTDGVEFKQNVEETDGIAWFTPEDVTDLETKDNVKLEIQRAFSLLENDSK